MDMSQQYLIPLVDEATQPPTLRVLIGARRLINDPAHWCQGPLAEDMNRRAVPVEDERATRFCLLGAMQRIAAGTGEGNVPSRAFWAAHDAVRATHPQIARVDIGNWNDAPDRTHMDVLRLLDATIAAESGSDLSWT